MKRIIGLALAFLMLGTPAMAQEPSPTKEPTRLELMDAELAPIHQRIKSAETDLESAAQALFLAAWNLDTEKAREYADAVEKAIAEVDAAADEGLVVLDAYSPPDECFESYWAVERVGFDALSQAITDKTGMGLGFYMILTYADLQRSITVCE